MKFPSLHDPETFQKDKRILFLLFIFIFLSRIPFIFYGYGSEEDAWSVALNASIMHQTGVYEYSRLPGHPVQEVIFALLYSDRAYVFNLITVIISTIGFLYFFRLLKLLGATSFQSFYTTLFTAFIPIAYIHSTNSMDYMWAFSFITIATYYLLTQKIITSALFISLAFGCRVSSLLMLPFMYYFLNSYNNDQLTKSIRKHFVFSCIFCLILLLPLFSRYGIRFIDFYAQQYPSFAKALYKYTLALTGLGGIIVTGIALYLISKSKNSSHKKSLILVSLGCFIIHSMWYWYMPQKAAFMIPALFFPALLLGISLKETYVRNLMLAMFLCNFTFGINFIDTQRGSNFSGVGYSKEIHGQTIALDLMNGPLTADIQKRKNKMSFIQLVSDTLSKQSKNSVILAGFYLSELLKTGYAESTNDIILVYRMTESEMIMYRNVGYSIYYLPEQEYVNDTYYGKQFTTNYAEPLLSSGNE